MEKGNEHIQQLEEKKSAYKKQVLQLRQQTTNNLSSKDQLIKNLEDQLQQKAQTITAKNSEIRELNIDK
jgi:hypothetical protein